MNKLFTNISKKNTTELNELIYVGKKWVCDKNGAPKRTQAEIQNLYGKFDWKYRSTISTITSKNP